MRDQSTRRGAFLGGMQATIPMVIGAIPFGIIFGAVAITSGISAWGTVGMSLIVFAGSAQFIGVGLVAQGVGLPVIVLTTLIVNLRHALYSASLAPYVKGLSQKWLIPLGFWLTDETYATVIHHFQQAPDAPHKRWFFLGSEVFMYVCWQICTVIGILAGQQFRDAAQWGLDFALIVTFIAIVVPLIRTRPVAACVLVSGISALLTYGLPNKMGLMLSALLGIAAGMIVEARQPAAVLTHEEASS